MIGMRSVQTRWTPIKRSPPSVLSNKNPPRPPCCFYFLLSLPRPNPIHLFSLHLSQLFPAVASKRVRVTCLRARQLRPPTKEKHVRVYNTPSSSGSVLAGHVGKSLAQYGWRRCLSSFILNKCLLPATTTEASRGEKHPKAQGRLWKLKEADSSSRERGREKEESADT